MILIPKERPENWRSSAKACAKRRRGATGKRRAVARRRCESLAPGSDDDGPQPAIARTASSASLASCSSSGGDGASTPGDSESGNVA